MDGLTYDSFVGLHKDMKYQHPPQNRYQDWIRGGLKRVSQHYTPKISPQIAQKYLTSIFLSNQSADVGFGRVVHVPVEHDANWEGMSTAPFSPFSP